MAGELVEDDGLVPIYRRSALDAASCPKRFYELYERPDPIEDGSDAALRGQAFHETARIYILRLAEKNLTGDAEELKESLDEAIAALRVPSHLIKEVENLAEKWAMTFEFDQDSFLLAEETQTLTAEDLGEDYGLQWTPDLVYVRGGELEQVDWKTYWAGITDKEVKHEFQAQVYVWQAAQKWPNFERYRFTFNYPRLGFSSTAVWTAEEVEELEVVVKSRVAIINECRKSGEWKANPGSMCVFCRLDCPVKDHESLDVSRVKTEEEAKRIAGELLVYEKAVTARKDALRAWCGDTGPLVSNGVQWGFTESESISFPADDVIRVLENHGIESRDFSLTKTALRSYLKTKKHKEVAEDLESIAIKKKRSVFGSRVWRGGGD